MNEGLEYAQMLEIPVSTVNVVKKKSLFPRRSKTGEDLKERTIESVNERMDGAFDAYSTGGFVQTEELVVPQKVKNKKEGTASKILIGEAIAACLIAAGIFITNIFVSNTAINTFMGGLSAVKEKEATYNELTLSSVVGDFSDTEVAVTSDGVLHFTDKATIYPVCDGKVASVSRSGGLYTVKIAHTSEFCSVITGLDQVYVEKGDAVKFNIPFAYSQGENEVRVSMYNGETQLSCYTLSGTVPVWNS